MANLSIYRKAIEHLISAVEQRHPLLEANIHRTSFHNPWLEKSNYWKSLDALTTRMVSTAAVLDWCEKYQFPVTPEFQRTIGLIFAGNIPLVGFHDFVTVYLSGHRAEIKMSTKDPYVFPAVLDILNEVDPEVDDRFRIVEKLENFDAVIATGSNNTNRYFRKYFGGYPSILRSNRTSIAVLDGSESNDELRGLGHDIFDYFGLGCRNVTKLFVPEGYTFEPLLEVMEEFSIVMNNVKYKNNYDYNLSIELLNRSDILSTSYVMLKRDRESLFSPVGMVYYDTYTDRAELLRGLSHQKEQIQTVVGKYGVEGISRTDFGETQQPGLFDYPDGEDLGHFLFQLTCMAKS